MEFTVELPQAGDKRVAIHATPAAIRQIRAGHPWVWDGSIEREPGPANPGDLAVVFDRRRRFAGIGLYDPNSPIRVRVLHAGDPRQIDDDFFADLVLAALACRQPLADDPDTTAYRLIHGENDGLGGLVIDRYESTLVVRLDTAAWLAHLATVLTPLADLIPVDRIVLRTGRQVALPAPLHDGMVLSGDRPAGPVPFLEHGLVFEADVEHGHKTGHFLDQRDNRQLVAQRCVDAAVLDVFSHTGGFSVHAAAAGARSVHSIDASPHAIDAARHHMAINRRRLGLGVEHSTTVADAFDAMDELAGRRARFDVVIVDPPSFAPNAAAVGAARRAYRRLTALAIELLGSGGTLFQASCSSRIDAVDFHDLIAEQIDLAGWKATNEVRTTHGIDHPIGFAEGAYLKAHLADLIAR